MSAGFDSLYYTDCLPGQGLQGAAGFQFQAATPGLAAEAMPVVQRTALYEPPASWTRERRPVTDYPLSLAHTADRGLFATAAGRYRGQEANGTREGNQFTHAVVTRDPADYGLVRPAQLWAATWWAVEPAPSTELDVLPAHPAPGPLDTETVRDRIRDASGGEERLTALLSAIHHLANPEHRRTVVLVATDPEEAACWVAAATLLLPRPQALRASFKIFVADGQYGQHNIIALHPEWAGRWADTGSGSGLAVFDLDRGRHSAVEPTAAARFWVPRFLTADPYDVVDAVELAGQFARARADGPEAQAEPTDADRLAAVVVAASERLTAPGRSEEAADWLLTAPEEAIRIARDAVLEAVLEAAPPAPVLRTLVAAAESGGWVPAAVGIKRGLLTAEVGEAVATTDGVAALAMLTSLPRLQRLDLSGEDREHGRAEVEAALRGARPDQLPALLTVAHRHGARPATTNFRDAAYQFAEWWVERPEPELEPERWPAPPDALDWVRDVLRGWLAGPHRAHAVAAIRACWWRPLWEAAGDPGDELDKLLMSAAYKHLEGARRELLMREVQEWAFTRMPGGAYASTAAWDIVFDRRTPPRHEAAAFLAGLLERGLPFSHDVGTRLCAVLEQERELSEEGQWINEQLHKNGHPLPAKLAELHARDDAVLRVADELRATAPTRTGAELAAALSAATAPLLQLRARTVVDGLIVAPRDTALAVIRGCSRKAAAPIYRALIACWPRHAGAPSENECRAVAFAFVLATSPPKSAQQREDFGVLHHQLSATVAAMSSEGRAAVGRCAGDLGQPWWDWVAEIEPSRWKRPLGFLSTRSGKPSGKRRE